MSNIFVVSIFIVVGLINFAPVIGALSSAQLEQLYQIKVNNSDIELLLRHRAVLFGIVGGILICAAFIPSIQALAWVIGMISMLSFIGLFLIGESSSDALVRIVWIDAFAIALLAPVPILRDI